VLEQVVPVCDGLTIRLGAKPGDMEFHCTANYGAPNVADFLGVCLTRGGGLAALGQALIPYYTGIILDQATMDPDRNAFRATVVKLMIVSLACAVFTGVRGGLFTLAMARLNVRFRQRLYGSLLNQEIAFFDSTKTGAVASFDHTCTARAGCCAGSGVQT
jgi:hypothetical protein